jgi:molybdopterin-containing oxidoreductase family iron-sulfur binding subunit
MNGLNAEVSKEMTGNKKDEHENTGRRTFIKSAGSLAAAAFLSSCDPTTREAYFQKHFQELSKSDLDKVIKRLEHKYSKQYKKKVTVGAIGPQEGVVFGYALDLSRCIGCRRCVYACVTENNQSHDPQIHWIRVLEFDRRVVIRRIDFEKGNEFYTHTEVPAEDKTYTPVACQQCENPECVKACPATATWQEPDGIVVIDYDWCVGCRYCMTACPYGARHFNWAEPKIPSEEINPDTHFLGNRPRPHGVPEKCTWCIQRSRKGRYTACVEVCPVGARKFGNILDPDSEIRQLIEHKRTFVLKGDLDTKPKFFYFYSFYG